MARKHKKHSRRRGSRSRRSSRRSFRSFVRNDSGVGGEILTALLSGTAGYAVSRGLATVGMRFLPSMIPQRELVSNALAGGVVTVGAEMLMKSMPGARKGVIVGAWIPAGEAALNLTGLGRMIGTERLVLLPAPAPGGGGSPTPQALNAALAAALDASLDDNPYSQPY